jgi:DNA-binding beta-propeller fold protein YncE
LVSDTNNNRIQKFTSEGTSLGAIGRPGSDNGEFSGPDGLAVDPEGNIYVADTGNQRIQKLSANGTFLLQWKGPPPGFYGPRDIVLGPDNSVYVVDQGNGRIVTLDKSGNLLAVWGSSGKGDGQFIEPSSVAVDGKNDRVYVADPRNQRIQVFDTKGSFIAKWLVKEWQPNPWLFQRLVLDPKRARLYASSLATDEVLIFDLQGNKVGSLRPKPPDKLEGASAMALVGDKLYVLCTFANRVTEIDLAPEFGQPTGRN